MNMKHILGYAIALCLPFNLSAQVVESLRTDVVSKRPIASEDEIQAKLFEVSPEDANYYFRANLPGNQYLVMEFKKIGYWPVKGTLKQMFAAAESITGKVVDSFGAATSKRIDVHLPVENEPVTVRLNGHDNNSRLLVIKGRMQGALKVGMDTINVLKTFSQVQHKNSTELNQVHYSFILKDANEIKKLAADDALINEIENKLDELVQKKRRQWLMDNAWFHAMNASYTPTASGGPSLQKDISRRFITDAFGLQCNAGASLLSLGVAPYFSFGLSFKWPAKERNESHFLRASLSTLSMIETLPSKKIESHGVVMANLESGRFYYNKKTGIPLYEISVGVGTKISPSDFAPLSDGITRLFINYSLSKSITITPDIYYLQHVSAESSTQFTGGLTLTLRLF